ncbi:MAG TPA: ABC transporter permease [Vicinamibacterales bacterium]|nr:ABC transporter permease [Vicinamibacterales bacterium]
MKRSLRSWLWRVPLDQEVDEELAFHIEMRTRELVDKGMDSRIAREMVLARLGDVGRLKRTCVDLGRKRDREMRFAQWFDERRQDVRFALRQLKSSPAFTLVAAITLALGIGANSAMFALADATLLRPLPYPDADRLVMVWERSPAFPRVPMSPVTLLELAEQNRSFESLGGVNMGIGGGPLLEAPDGSLLSVDRQFVTARLFDALGVQPIAGRTFRPDDEGPVTTVIVISEGLWRTRFGADPSLIGRDVRLNGQPFTVIGIVPDDVQLQRPARVWSLLTSLPDSLRAVPAARGARSLQVVGRLKPDVTLEAAQAELAVYGERLARDYPATHKGFSVNVEPLRAAIMGPDLQLTSLFLFGVVGFVLLLCCANVANLLLARGSVRSRELAVRSALGAGKSRILAQLLTESLVLATVGGLVGLALGAAILKLAIAVIPAGLLPAAVSLTFDGRVMAFCVAASVVAGVLFGVVPAWQATRSSLVQTIASESRSSTRRGGRFRSFVVAGEVAAAVLLLCGAGLLLRTLLVLGDHDPGYRAHGDSVLTLDFSLPAPNEGTRYPTFESFLQFYDDTSRQVAAIPGVTRIGWTTALPYGSSELPPQRFEIIGDPPVARDSRPFADFQAATPGYFTTLDLPIVTGRSFTDRDTRESTPVIIVNEAFVRHHLAGRDPIGIRLGIEPLFPGFDVPAVWEIVGVARQVKGRMGDRDDARQVYVPLAQYPWTDTFLVVHSDGPVQALLAPIRDVVARIDRNVPVRRERTLNDLASQTTAPHRFRAAIVTTFAGLALTLALVGIFGVLTYSVEQRMREFGVRIALGATAANVLRLVLGSAARVIALGAVVGLIAAAGLGQVISMFLVGVRPLDPMTFASVVAVLAITAVAAAAAPAIRAVRVDPVEAFRNE